MFCFLRSKTPHFQNTLKLGIRDWGAPCEKWRDSALCCIWNLLSSNIQVPQMDLVHAARVSSLMEIFSRGSSLLSFSPHWPLGASSSLHNLYISDPLVGWGQSLNSFSEILGPRESTIVTEHVLSFQNIPLQSRCTPASDGRLPSLESTEAKWGTWACTAYKWLQDSAAQ